MSESLKALYEKKGKLVKEGRDLNEKVIAENREYTAEEDQNYKRIHEDLVKVSAQIKRTEELAEFDKAQDRAADDNRAIPGRDDFDPSKGGDRDNNGIPAAETRALAFQAWMREQSGLFLEERHVEACRAAKLNPRAGSLSIQLAPSEDFRNAQRKAQDVHPTQFHRAMSGVNLSTGGSLVAPESLVNSLEVNMLAFGGMLQTAEVIRTDNGSEMGWPVFDDTSSTGAQLGENTAADMTTAPSTGKKTWYAYEFTSKGVLVPTSLMEDSAFNLPSVIGSMLGERLGRILNTKCTTGSGAGTPEGIITGASAATLSTGNAHTASATAITADEILDFTHSINPAYRIGAGFMMHDNVLLAIRKLKSNDSQYIWQPGLSMGVPDKLLGYPLTINQDMASSITNSAKTMLFGQLSKYKIRQVREIRIYRLVERYREYDQDGFVAFTRFDGKLLNAGTAPVKYLQQAT